MSSHSFSLRAIALACIMAASAFLVAQEQPAALAPNAIDAGTISVKADALSPSNAAPASDIVVITPEQIKAVKARYLSDLLSLVAGVNIKNYGNAGGVQSVSIRGSTSAQVVLVIDGQRINDLYFGQADLVSIQADEVEKIEILRGGASAAYGADAVGGVIRVTTKHPKKDSLNLTVENRSYIPEPYKKDGSNEDVSPDPLALVNGQHFAISGNRVIDLTRLYASGSFDRDMGLYNYNDSTGINRQRTQGPSFGVAGKVGVNTLVGGGSLGVDLNADAKRTGIPGDLIFGLTPHSYSDSTGGKLAVSYKSDFFISDAFNFDAQAWAVLSKFDTEGDNPENKSSAQQFYTGLDLRQSAIVGDVLTLNYGLSGRYDTMKGDYTVKEYVFFTTYDVQLKDKAGTDPIRVSGAAFLNPVLTFGTLTLSPSFRVDLYSDVPVGLSGTLGVEIALSNTSSFWLSLARAYRAPTFSDLYFPDPSTPGNPNLKPETAWTGDFGFSYGSKQLSGRSAVFTRYVEDAIDWADDGTGVYTPSNVDKSFYIGFDQDLSIKIDWLRLGLNYEYNKSFFLADGKTFEDNIRINYVPEHLVRLNMGIRQDQIEFGFSQEFKSLRFSNKTNSTSLPAYFVLNAQVTWWLTEESSVWLAADNLFNTRYESQAGYPMPGLGLRLGLKLSI